MAVSDTQHNLCRENSVFIGEVACTIGFFGDVANGFDSYSAACPFGGLKNIVFLLYFAVKSVFNMDEKQMSVVQRDQGIIREMFCV